MNALDMSKRQVPETVTDGGIVLAHATAARMVAVHPLTPASRDPGRCDRGSWAGRRRRLGGVTGGWFCWFLQQKIDGLPSR